MTVLLQPSSWKERKVIIPSKEMQWILLSFGQKAKFIELNDEMKYQGALLSQDRGILQRVAGSTQPQLSKYVLAK